MSRPETQDPRMSLGCGVWWGCDKPNFVVRRMSNGWPSLWATHCCVARASVHGVAPGRCLPRRRSLGSPSCALTFPAEAGYPTLRHAIETACEGGRTVAPLPTRTRQGRRRFVFCCGPHGARPVRMPCEAPSDCSEKLSVGLAMCEALARCAHHCSPSLLATTTGLGLPRAVFGLSSPS